MLVAGFVDPTERPLRFHAMYRSVFLECGGTLLSFGVLADTGRMQIASIRSVHVVVELDDDLQPASTSIRETVLEDPDGSNRIRTIQLWDTEGGPDGIECAAARLDLENGQIVFIDPTYHFGIRIGGIHQQDSWLNNSTQREHDRIVLDMSDAAG
ncbi:MAG: hypothetical protein NT062_11470 [Proteobacteria bacterium]|nr:hypothetical protein [Pseudomonadota bacterium]